MAKKHGHEAKHAHCEHCLHACDHCEVAYCCDCNKEWGTCRLSHSPYWPYWAGTTTTILDTTTPTVTTTDFPTNNTFTYISADTPPVDCIHAHTN